MTKKKDDHQLVHGLLSDLTDQEPNIYELTKDLARISKQIKEDTKEDPEPPKPLLEAINKIHELTAD